MDKRDLTFFESEYMNNRTFQQFYSQLAELAVSMFDWKNLPDTVDPRYLEMSSFLYGEGKV